MGFNVKNMTEWGKPCRRIIRGAVLLFAAAVLFPGCAQDRAATREKAEAVRNLGNAMIREGQVRPGLMKLLEAERMDAQNADIQHELGLTYQRLGQLDEALVRYRRALTLRPRFPEAWNNRGTLHLQLRQWAEAVPCFEKAVADPAYRTPEYAWNNLGLAYYHMDMHPKAVESYLQALKFLPNYSVCLTNLGRAYEAMGDRGKAEEAYRASVEANPEYTLAHIQLAGIYLEQGRDREAADLLGAVIASEPKGPGAGQAREMLRRIGQ